MDSKLIDKGLDEFGYWEAYSYKGYNYIVYPDDNRWPVKMQHEFECCNIDLLEEVK